MPEHGTVECFDGGCRRPVCVYAQTMRVEAARRAEVAAIAVAAMPPPTVPEVPAEDPPSGEPSIDQPAE